MRSSALAAMLTMTALALPGAAAAAPLEDDGGAEWKVEQPLPPPPETAGGEPSSIPVSIGHIGQISFWAPNRGVLITAGNGGSVKPGVWFYNGAGWKELSNQCGSTDGRIAWASEDEFWTVSDGRAGAASTSTQVAPIEDNTLCHFAPGPEGNIEIVASYASLPFLGSSYQPMHGAACVAPDDCWFGGEPLPAPQIGEFMLHWNGATLEPIPFLGESHAIETMAAFEGRVWEGLQNLTLSETQRPAALRAIRPTTSLEESPFDGAGIENHLLYSPSEFSTVLDYLRVGTDTGSLWAGAGAIVPKPEGSSRAAGITILRRPTGGEWASVVGPQEEENEAQEPPGQIAFPKQVLYGIAPEPGTESAWLALDSEEDEQAPSALVRASVARISASGSVSDRLELPVAGDPHGPLGAAQHIVCPAVHDCWASTADGWLLHLATSGERESPDVLEDPAFGRIEAGDPVTFRPLDEGIPQEVSDEVPSDTSGEESFTRKEELVKTGREKTVEVQVPLLSHVHSRIVHRTTLVLSFHLAVEARIGLEALRHKKVVAKTGMKTLKAGNRSLRLELNVKRWPEHLKLKTKALAKLPTRPSRSPNVSEVSTSMVAPSRLLEAGFLP